jgi:hypothetical protein
MSKSKMKRGGSQWDINKTPIYILTLNIFMLASHLFIFINLYNNNIEYNITLYLFIALIIVSFFTIVFIIWGILNIYPIFDIFDDKNTENNIFMDEKDPTMITRFVSFILLTCCGLLQFIGSAFFVNVINNRVSHDNSFLLTVNNAMNLSDYEISYLKTYIAIIVVAMVIITPISNTNINRDKITYYFLLTITTSIMIYLSYKTFMYCFSIYSNVILKKNPLYQGNS